LGLSNPTAQSCENAREEITPSLIQGSKSGASGIHRYSRKFAVHHPSAPTLDPSIKKSSSSHPKCRTLSVIADLNHILFKRGLLSSTLFALLSAPLSALTVNTLADELDAPAGAAVSLREAIRDTPAGGTIDFSISVDGGLIFLSKGELVISKDLTIDASSLNEGIRLTSRGHRLISIQSSGVTFNKLTFTGSSSPDNGGAIHISNNSTVSLTDCLIKGNQATGFGGGIYSSSSTLNLVNTSVIENSSVDEGGGGIFSTGASASIALTGSTFQKNTAAKNGGAIQSTGNGTLSIVDSSLSDNSGRFGGGLSKVSGTLSITGSSITSNIATTAGGGLFLPRVTGDITNSTVAKNRSADNGGGIALDNNANLTVESCTIAANTSGNFCGGIFTQNSTLDLTNSIVATNLANASDDLHFQNGSITSGGANLVGINEGAETEQGRWGGFCRR